MFRKLIGSQEHKKKTVYGKQIDPLQRKINQETRKDNSPVTLYAELTKKQFQKLCSGEFTMVVPYGIEVRHRKSSRGVMFNCVDRTTARLLIDGLKNSGISWQEM